MEVPEGVKSTVAFRDKVFSMANIHLHSGSEHFLFGEQMQMEVHFVHKSTEGDILVVSSLITNGNILCSFYSIWY
jgi:carbonic anhydrase